MNNLYVYFYMQLKCLLILSKKREMRCVTDDVFWDDQEWKSVNGAINGVKDPHRLRINSYRVLLSRGRDGMVIYVPPEGKMDTTMDILGRMGLKRLPR